ncbi:MAG: insulinase family protein [Alphaproteobacteria bacterium]|nr:insulinase family protein [Alphaproteobacteria bacterium]MDE2014235.1 insulinase family protein [Alphaproteobacteria bacterium]MDE2075026.1 insulinase family protein [Alphaproteobacteria bacterium]
MRQSLRLAALAWAAAVFLAFPAFAAGTPAAAPAAPDQSPVTFQFALQNGLQVLVLPDHRAPVVTQMLWYRVGAVDDPPGVSGLAHFFEHMMFRGTQAAPGDQFSQTVARNGGVDNAFTTHDYTAFYEQIAKGRLKLVMGLEADRMANLDLSDKSVRTERQVVQEERRLRTDNNPDSLLGEQMEAALHLSHPYGRPVIGWPGEIAHIGRVEAQGFYTHHYAPNNAILVVAGDVTPAEVRDDAEATYGKLPARELVPRADYTQPPRLGPTRLSIRRSDVKLPVFERIYRVVSYTEARPGQAEALDVLAQAMGGDASAALYRRLVVDEKLAVDAGAAYDGYARDSGEFAVYATPRPGVSLERLEKATDAVIARFQKISLKPADLARAKTQLVAAAIYRRDSQLAEASAYGQALVIGLTVDDVGEWPDRIAAVTAADVKTAAVTGLLPKESVTGYLEPAPGAETARQAPSTGAGK